MRYLNLVFILFPFFTSAQVDHWESVVLPGNQWNYLVPTSQPNASWNQLGFDSSSWSTGPSGFGYGDEDDATVISPTMSVYVRKTFEITDATAVEFLVLDIDYDDGFVAYLNGQEIARNLVSGGVPDFNQASDGNHEAILYQGFAPERFGVDPSLLTTGTNTLAVQVHNQSFVSSDLTAIPVLSLGINTTDYNYSTPPDWFVAPDVPVTVNFESSNLPIVIIVTDQGQQIPNEPKIDATMKIIYRGEGVRNYLSDASDASTLDYDGAIKIEYRGSSSSLLDKKQYAFTPYDELGAKNNVSLLDMPKENDWILNGLAYDDSYMRDFISYKLSNFTGNYASRGRYCEVVLNGDFRGIYVLQEKLKADNNRIDINKIKETDLTFPKLTGGYVTKTDKTEGSDFAAWSMDNYGGYQSNFIHEHPKPTTVQSEQHEYIKNEFEILQEKIATPSNSSISNGYPSTIDIPSFIDFMILNELASNADGYEFSTFFHKDRNGKLRAGPIWDFNLTFGNDLFFWGLDRSHTDIWQFDDDGNEGPKFWKDLFDDAVFKCYLTKRWQELTALGMPLNSIEIFAFIDVTTTLISEAVERQETMSGTTGEFVDQISEMKTFISDRIEWMSSQLTDTNLCDNVTTPPLVISKINYNPLVDASLDSSDFEFIEIKNNSTSTIDLTGIYFGGLGFVYQFADGQTLSGETAIFLSNESDSFNDRYGFEPFGEFSRSLSNDGEDLILRDAYGNIIDEVTYNDVLPWPVDADGAGSFLKLVSVDLDNSLASSWVAVNDTTDNLSVNSVQFESFVSLSPNPVSDKLKIKISKGKISSLKLWSLNGKLFDTYKYNNQNVELDLSDFENGLYLLQIQTNSELLFKKIIKN
ncbi:MAG: CotH kinase family protein [Flavobacteriaceae bacterium]|nr:CotH kinase family protein [Flavobacteriaceae bacterium]